LLFAPNSDGLQATTELIVRKSLDRWLAGQIQVQTVTVGRGDDDSQLLIRIEYLLIETRTKETLELDVK
jgi:hypothetical protein